MSLVWCRNVGCSVTNQRITNLHLPVFLKLTANYVPTSVVEQCQERLLPAAISPFQNLMGVIISVFTRKHSGPRLQPRQVDLDPPLQSL
jgi:hypothetical protein